MASFEGDKAIVFWVRTTGGSSTFIVLNKVENNKLTQLVTEATGAPSASWLSVAIRAACSPRLEMVAFVFNDTERDIPSSRPSRMLIFEGLSMLRPTPHDVLYAQETNSFTAIRNFASCFITGWN